MNDFQAQIREIPEHLPELKPYDPSVNRSIVATVSPMKNLPYVMP
jgi:hypothetical protein